MSNDDGSPNAPEPGAGGSADPVNAEAWLDGLAGRSGAGADHAEGLRIRRALLAAESQAVVNTPPDLPWSELVRKAQELDAATLPVHDLIPLPTASAANAPSWQPMLAWAAALLLGTAVVTAWAPWQADLPAEGLRGVGQASDAALWQVADPAAAATSLASELRALGARVEQLDQSDGSVTLTIDALEGTQADAVNQRLAELETALDGRGRLKLRVVSR